MTSTTIPDSVSEPQNQDARPILSDELLREAATQGLELAELAAQVFESGTERPDASPGLAFLRDALRSARTDLDLLGTAVAQSSPATVVHAATRAESLITFALAVHSFLERFRGQLDELRVADSAREG